MTTSSNRVAKLLVHCAGPFSTLRRIPIVGDLLSWTSRRLVPNETLVWVQIENGAAAGLWIGVNPRTGQSVRLAVGELAVQKAVREHLRPGMTFYDLGANIGFYSLMAARLVGPAGRVIAFEADPEIASRLRDNLAYNKLDNVTVEQKAVWFESAIVSFVRVDANVSPDRGLGHIDLHHSPPAASIPVEAVSIDQFTATHPLPDFLKCDVEGAEVAVFQGAEYLLRIKRPILLVEMHSPENHRLLAEKFAERGYTCTALDDSHILALPQ
jgi:FkbM family methyltransferase